MPALRSAAVPVFVLWVASSAQARLSGIAPTISPAIAVVANATAERDPALQTYLSANGLLSRGLYELAAEEYRKFLSQNPSHDKADVARYGLGVSLFRLKQYDKAIETLTPLYGRAKFEYAAEVGTMLGQSHMALKHYAKAASAYNWVVAKRSDHALADDAAVGRIEALYLNGDPAGAIVAGQQFITQWPASPLRDRAEFFSALAMMAGKEFGKAADRFDALRKRSPQGPFAQQATLLLAQCRQNDGSLEPAVRAYRDVLKQAGSPYIPDALFSLATLLQHLDQPVEAGDLLDRLLAQYPNSEHTETARFQRGRVWFDQHQFDRASAQFKDILKGESPFSDQAAYWLAKCEIRQGKFRPAARRLKRAIERFPKSTLRAEMYYDRGIALIRAERYARAIGALDTFRQTFPKHKLVPQALRLAAVAEHQRQRFDESLAYCHAFLQQFASHDLAPSIAYLSGENEYLAGRYEAAVTAFRRFLARYPDDSQSQRAVFRLGTSLYRLKRLDEARDQLALVVKGAETDDVFRPALLSLGDIHFQRSEWKKAETYLVDYLAGKLDAPLADEALLKIGLARQRDGRPQEAIDAYDRLIAHFEKSPHRLQALFERGQALVSTKHLDEASRAFSAVLEAGESSRFAAYALNHMAAIAAKRGRMKESAKLYARLASQAPGNDMKVDALFQEAQSYMALQRFDAAEKAFADFVARFPASDRIGTVYAKRAIAIARQDRCKDALRAIKKAENHSLDRQDKALVSAVRYEKAWCLRKLGRDEEAAGAYRSLISRGDVDSLGAHAMLELADMNYTQERFADAAKLLHRVYDAMKQQDSKVTADVKEQAVYRLGLCHFKLGQPKRAAALFHEFLTMYPDSSLTASACFFYGESQFSLGRYELAAVPLARVPQEFASDPLCGPSLLRLGEALANMQRWARSEQAFADYLDRFAGAERSYQAQFGLAWARENQKRYDEAVHAYEQVVAGHQGPTAARAQFQIGECRFAQRKYDEAVRAFLKVDILYAYPEWSAAALYEAGRCFEKLGKPVEARHHFKMVSQRHQDTRWATMAAQRLTELSDTGVPGQ